MKSLKNKKKFFYFKIIVILILSFFIALNYKFTWVKGDSMLPTLKENTLVVYDKNLFKLFPLTTGDIVVFKINGNYSVKRVIGIPMDKILMEDGSFLINSENYSYMLRYDEYFLAGDNPEKSHDSRHFGPIKKIDIVGKVILKY
jgi:signal peptidase I